MRKIIAILTIVLLVVVVYSCKKSTSVQDLKTVSLVLPPTPANYYPSTFDSSMNKTATLGRVLFYDSHLSVNNAISCGSCHKQALGFGDNSAFSTGYQGLPTKRNSLPISDLSLAGSLFWDGREDRLANLSLRPISNHVEMGISDFDALCTKLAALPYYTQLFHDAYGDNQITSDRISGALGVFMQAITTGNSRFDQYNAGNKSVLTAQEIEGMNLFNTKYNCGTCHNGGGGYYGNGSFKDIGLDNSYSDLGRGEVTGIAADNGSFRIPNLRNVALTAPYMHDGRYKTLGD